MKTIRVTVDSYNEPSGGLAARAPIENLFYQVGRKTLELDTDMLAAQLGDSYQTVVEALVGLRNRSEEITIKDVEFSLGIDSTGNVSLLSTVSGSAATSAGLKFTLSFKEQ